MSKKLKVVFMGTPEFAIPSLATLLTDERFEVVAVYTQPDRPAGRGRQLAAPPVKVLAEKFKTPVLQPEKFDETEVVKLQRLAPEFLVVVAYGIILPQAVLDIPRIAPVNLHGSLLPYWRGASPIQAVILAGESETGVSFMQMETGLDTGPVYERASYLLTKSDTAKKVAKKIAKLGGEKLPSVLARIATGKLRPKLQNKSEATSCQKVRKEDGRIDWGEDSATLIKRKVRAYSPWPGVFTFFRDKQLKILELTPLLDSEGLGGIQKSNTSSSPLSDQVEDRLSGRKGISGEVFEMAGKVCVVAAAGSVIELKKVQLAGKRAMEVAEFVRGEKKFVGSRLQ